MNEEILKYLDYYADLSVSPSFAVLLDGAWGSGKTFLAERWKKRLVENRRRVLYVSTYGFRSVSEIDAAIFAALHPFLSNSKAKFVGRILAGAVKFTTNVDLGMTGPDESKATISVPKIDLEKLDVNSVDSILIFDDLERSQIDPKALFGYLNYFVEQLGLKVLLIADEAHLREQEAYAAQREKVVGRVLRVEPDFDSAFEMFVNDLQDKCSEFFKKHNEIVKRFYSESLYNNLRLLRRSLLDFERLFTHLSNTQIDEESFVNDLLSVFLPLAFEFGQGKLTANTMDEFFDRLAFSLRTLSDKSAEKTPVELLREKYTVVAPGSLWRQSSGFWKSFFVDGVVDPNELRLLIDGHPSFFKESTPAWKRYWWWADLSQPEFDELNVEIETSLREHKILNAYVLLHIFGIRLSLAKHGFLDARTEAAEFALAKRYFLYCSKKGLLDFQSGKNNRITFNTSTGYDGLGFHSRSSLFKELSDFVHTIVNDEQAKQQKNFSQDLLKFAEHDHDEWMLQLGNINGPYSQFPALKYLSASKFKKILGAFTTARQYRDIAVGISDRYKYTGFNYKERYGGEERFFEALFSWLSDRERKSKGKIMQDGVKKLVEAVQSASSKLK